MARGSKVLLNRNWADPVKLAIADGMFRFAQSVITAADVPDLPPIGQGLIQGGGALAWVDGKKVNGTTIGGRSIKKPRSIRPLKNGVTVIGGYGFPARFVELGTSDTRPHPFLRPTLVAASANAEDEITTDAAAAFRVGGG